jgi:hypothetical protein
MLYIYKREQGNMGEADTIDRNPYYQVKNSHIFIVLQSFLNVYFADEFCRRLNTWGYAQAFITRACPLPQIERTFAMLVRYEKGVIDTLRLLLNSPSRLKN